VTIAGISTDGLYPLRLQHELADLIPRNKGVEVVHSIAGHDGFLTEHEAIGDIVAGALV
jgi:homoserine O-acetyltransferase/O-succinyltransferase